MKRKKQIDFGFRESADGASRRKSFLRSRLGAAEPKGIAK